MTASCRRPLGAVTALALAIGLGPAAFAESVIKVVPYADLKIIDPIWTTSNITAYHGALIYDTLFGVDDKLQPKPQMVDTWTLSDDKLTYVFKLRSGLKWHDGTPVTAEDCVASLKRWAVRDGAGQLLMQRTASLTAEDAMTLKLVLKEPFGLVLDFLGKTSTPLAFMMRKKDAETDPFKQITEAVGSGPFKFVKEDWVPGSKVVYVKNADYVPRQDPTNGFSGGKVVHVDRVEFDYLPDAQTAQAALVNGEIDYYENPPIDLLPILKAAPNVTVAVTNPAGNVGVMRLNHLQPPFDNPKARQALLYLFNQTDYLQAMIGNSDYYRTCSSVYTCGTPMEVKDPPPWFGHPDIAKAKELLKEAGYDGRPVVILQPTDVPQLNAASLVTADALRKAGINVDLQAMDFSTLTTRRTKKEPIAQGGWNIFHTWSGGISMSNPIILAAMSAGCDKAWFGWPCDADYEKMRDAWMGAPTLDERKAMAVKLQQRFYDDVIFVPYGIWTAPIAYRSDRLKNVLGVPEILPMWQVEKVKG
jgi:peptide/nickel transport system substrate-binding protein